MIIVEIEQIAVIVVIIRVSAPVGISVTKHGPAPSSLAVGLAAATAALTILGRSSP